MFPILLMLVPAVQWATNADTCDILECEHSSTTANRSNS